MKRDSLRVITSFSCNQRCPFCYQQRWDKNFLTIEDLIEQLQQHQLTLPDLNQTFNNISIMGGEPFLHPNLSSLLSCLRNSFTGKINLDTNGKLLVHGGYKHYIHLFKQLDRLSIDFAYPQTQSKVQDVILMFDKVLVLKQLLNQFPHLTIKCNHVFTEKNYDSFHEMFQFFLHLIKPIYQTHSDRLLITICEDVVKTDPRITLETFIKDFSAQYKTFIENSRIHILTVGNLQVGYFTLGYFGLADFRDSDLIVWKSGSTDSFTDYLKIVRK